MVCVCMCACVRARPGVCALCPFFVRVRTHHSVLVPPVFVSSLDKHVLWSCSLDRNNEAQAKIKFSRATPKNIDSAVARLLDPKHNKQGCVAQTEGRPLWL